MGYGPHCIRREGSKEGIFIFSGNFERYAVCMEQRVSEVEKGTSIEVEGDSSNLNERGDVSLLGESMLHPVRVNNCFDVTQLYNAIVDGKESCVSAAVAEVVSWDSTSEKASVGGQFTTAFKPRNF